MHLQSKTENNSVIQDFYAKKKQQGKAHKVAQVAALNKLLKVIYSVSINKTIFIRYSYYISKKNFMRDIRNFYHG